MRLLNCSLDKITKTFGNNKIIFLLWKLVDSCESHRNDDVKRSV